MWAAPEMRLTNVVKRFHRLQTSKSSRAVFGHQLRKHRQRSVSIEYLKMAEYSSRTR